MKKLSFAALVAAAFAVGHLRLTAAETAKFKHVVSVYADEKGAGLKSPEGVACDARGRVVIGDTGNDRVLRFSYQDNAVSGGTEIKTPELSAPAKIQLSSKGDIYALDSKRRRIVHLGTEGDFKNALAFDGVSDAAGIVPKSFAIDAADNIYVADIFGARVLTLNADGQFQKELPFPDGVGFVSDLAVDGTGTVFLLDSVKRRIFSAAKDAASFGPVGGDLAESVTTLPTSIAAANGIIFVVEGIGSAIVTFARDGSFLARQLTMGWSEAALNHPSQMCVTDKDVVFVADRDNSRVQVFGLIR